MKYCQRCGAQVDDQVVVCPCCQNFTENPNAQPMYYQPPVKPESGALSVCALVFSVLMPLVGLILGIVGICRHQNPDFKSRCKIAIIISVVMMVVSAIVSIIVFTVFMNFVGDVITEFPYQDYSGSYVAF